jgi:hypothetical protein
MTRTDDLEAKVGHPGVARHVAQLVTAAYIDAHVALVARLDHELPVR